MVRRPSFGAVGLKVSVLFAQDHLDSKLEHMCGRDFRPVGLEFRAEMLRPFHFALVRHLLQPATDSDQG